MPLLSILLACVEDPPVRPPPAPPPPPPGNVVIVILDDIGIDQVGRTGLDPEALPTPTLDRLIDEGTWFRNAYGYSVCSPTRAALLTGRHPHHNGVGAVIHPEDIALMMPDEEVTLAERLADAPHRWDTSFVGKWHLASFDTPGLLDLPRAQGFAWWQGSMGNLADAGELPDRPLGYHHWERVTNGVAELSTTYATVDTTDAALERIEVMEEPWLMVVAHNAAHGPYGAAPPPELAQADGELAIDVYGAMVTALDAELGRLVDGLPPDTTLIVVTDNGTPSFAIADPKRAPQGKGSVFELGVRVFMVVTGPLVARPGEPSDALVELVDVFPTVAALAGVDPGPVDGLDLAPVLADPTDELRPVAFSTLFAMNADRTPVQFAVRDQHYKLLSGETEDLRPLDAQGLEGDPLDLAALDPEAAEALERLRAEIDLQTR